MERLGEKRLRKLRIAIVVSMFNQDITRLLLEGCCTRMHKLGIPANDIHFVPGALEVPFMVKTLAVQLGRKNRPRHDGFIALGCVIRGQTRHFDVVSDVSAAGLQQVQLEIMIPVTNGILTVENFSQALKRAEEKPAQCVDALVSLLAAVAAAR